METIPITTPDQPITYFGVAYVFSQADNQRFQHIVDLLHSNLSDLAYLAPSPYRHITIAGITSVSETRADKPLLDFMHLHKQEIEDVLDEASSTTPRFTVNFTQLEVHKRAIILRAEDSQQMAGLRSKLHNLPTLNAHINQPNFVHTSIARYKQTLPIERISQITSGIEFSIRLTIDTISLVYASSSFSNAQEIMTERRLR